MEPSLSYLAGFFDGEGSIGIYKNGRRTGWTLRVQITQTISVRSTELLTVLRGRWGGSLCPFNKKLRRAAWNWQVSAKNGYLFLCDIRPWLLLKADQADVALNWWSNRLPPQRGKNGRILLASPEVRAANELAARTLKELKEEVHPIDQVMADAADLVEIRHTLRQIVNVKGD